MGKKINRRTKVSADNEMSTHAHVTKDLWIWSFQTDKIFKVIICLTKKNLKNQNVEHNCKRCERY